MFLQYSNEWAYKALLLGTTQYTVLPGNYLIKNAVYFQECECSSPPPSLLHIHSHPICEKHRAVKPPGEQTRTYCSLQTARRAEIMEA